YPAWTYVVDHNPPDFAGTNRADDTIDVNDNRYILFCSTRADLVPNDTNARQDVFVTRAWGDQPKRISAGLQDLEGRKDADSGAASIAPDGRYVAFVSDAGNLTPG